MWESVTRSQSENERVKFAPQGSGLILQRDRAELPNQTHRSAATQYQTLLCLVLQGGRDMLHSNTHKCAHTHYAAYMQISSVCTDCDVGPAASPIHFSYHPSAPGDRPSTSSLLSRVKSQALVLHPVPQPQPPRASCECSW